MTLRSRFVIAGSMVAAAGSVACPGNGNNGAQMNADATHESIVAAVDTLGVPLIDQEGANWCWAASGQMVMSFLGHRVPQCVQADTQWSRDDCCPSPGASGCDIGAWPQFQVFGFSSRRTRDRALDWTTVKAEIGERRPVAFSWHWLGDGGHMMVLTGYQDDPQAPLVKINDPSRPAVTQWITYVEYVADSVHDDGEHAQHTHWDDYYTITYAGDAAVTTQEPLVPIPGPGAKPRQPSYVSPDSAARAAYQVLLRLPAVSQTLVHGQPLAGLAVGSGLPGYMVRLDSLRRYTTAKDPLSLLVKLGRVVFPLQRGRGVFTSITVRRSARGWELASFGAYDLRQLYATSLGNMAAAGQAVLVEIPGLHGISFVGALGPPLSLAALTTDSSLGLVAGQPIANVRSLFASLADSARRDTTKTPH